MIFSLKEIGNDIIVAQKNDKIDSLEATIPYFVSCRVIPYIHSERTTKSHPATVQYYFVT